MTIQTNIYTDTFNENVDLSSYQTIVTMLTRLSTEHVAMIEQFTRFLYTQTLYRQYDSTSLPLGNMVYPTIAVPANSLDMWLNLLPTGYEGNALEDTEALYDEV
ncbi:MAG: hypothetical protein B6242_03765 [Anaerolineaceae bacterium 4572_78]|nr:MAG: hypothetical protein B6242_03765 [Anaerolineaceae bacterium 4572_78]